MGAVLNLEADNAVASSPSVPVAAITFTVTLAGGRTYSRVLRMVKADFGGPWDGLPDKIKVVLADPANACKGLNNAGALRGALILAQRSGCYFSDKLRSAAAAGARALIAYNHLQDGYFPVSATDTSGLGSSSPAMGGIPASAGAWLTQAIAGGADVTASLLSTSAAAFNSAPFESVAGYSSFGPTPDGRLKPDLVAPGKQRVSPRVPSCFVYCVVFRTGCCACGYFVVSRPICICLYAAYCIQ